MDVILWLVISALVVTLIRVLVLERRIEKLENENRNKRAEIYQMLGDRNDKKI